MGRSEAQHYEPIVRSVRSDRRRNVVLLQVPENRGFVRLRIDSRSQPTPNSSWSTQWPFLV